MVARSLLLYELNIVLVSNAVPGGDDDRAIKSFAGWIDAGIIDIREGDVDLVRRAEAIASLDTQGKGHISSFDATYHALAIQEAATFVTADAAYVRKTQALDGNVVLLSEFKL